MLKRVKLLIGILPFCLMISVTAMAQSLQKIDVTLKNQTIKELITTIEKKTDYTFLYSNINVDAPIDIDVKGKSIQEVLNTVFKPYNISYEIKNKRIILKKGANGTTDETTDKITVKGIILDTRDEPLIGATIAIKSLPAGAVSDINGRFSLEVPRNSIISISYLGFISQKIKITDARELRIVLQENAKQLEDVVVVGYGVQKKVNLTGAVEAVGTEVFEGRSFPNTTQALQGAVSNLNISLADGKPQRTASFNVRGTTSIGQGGSALVLIDGVEGDPSLLNPNDIESVSVLKDAASAAIYGARGAFGVVLITTKSPQKGQVTVNYTGNFSFRSIAQKPEYVTDGVTYLEHYREAWWNQNGTVPVNLNGFQNYSDAWLDRMRAWKASGAEPKTEILPNGDYEHYYNMDHFGLLFKNSSFAQDHNLNISGGNEKSDFYISGRFYDFNGMYNYDPDVFSAYNLRAKGSLLATKWLRVSNSMEYSRDSYHQPLFGAAAGFISPQRCIEVTGFPTMPIYNPDGTYTRSAAFGIGGLINKTNYRDNTRNLFKNTIGFNTNFFDKTLRINGDYTFRYNISERFEKAVKVPFYDNANTTAPTGYFGDELGSIYELTAKTMYTASNLYAEYENTFADKHYVKAMVGWNYETSTYKANSISRNGLLLESAESVQLATGKSILPYADYIRWRTAGTFFRLNYGYQNRYLVEMNGRYDGSSRFPTDQQWGFFPSISGAWRLSEEPFWDVNNNIFSDIKFRASYGSLGNGNIPPYQYLELLSITDSGRVLNGALNKRTSAPAPIPDGLTWEKATTTNFGLDFGMLKSRLRFGGDYYIRKTTDMYVSGPTLPALFGASAPKGNYADMTTKGFELTLTWQDKLMVANKPFNYQIRGTLYDYISKIDKYNNPTKRFTDYYEGMTVGEIWGFETDGLFQSDPDPDEYINTIFTPSSDSRWRAGDLKIRNRDNSPDNMISRGDQTVDNPGDMTIIGNSAPRYQYSFTLSADWNGIFLSAFFHGVGKMDWHPGVESTFWGQYNRAYNQLPAWHINNYWTPDNPNAYLPRYRGGQNPPAFEANDRYLQKVSYLMLKNIQIGYTLPEAWLSKIGTKSARIYLSGENIASWSPLYKVAKNSMDVFSTMGTTDPDGDGSFDQGAGNGYPLLKTVSLGISLTF